MKKNNDLKIKYNKILQKFIEKYKKQPNVAAIIVFGSYVNSKLDKNSDLDVYIILKNSKTRERGNAWIDGVEIEYFINPIKQIKKYFYEERANKKFTTTHIFANSIVLYKNGNIINKLIQMAKKIIDKNGRMSHYEIELNKYIIDDIKKDIEDVYLKKDVFTFNLIVNKLILKCIDIFFDFNKIIEGRPKKIGIKIKEVDLKFKKIISHLMAETNIDKKFIKANKLIKYLEKILGGKRLKNWKLISQCTLKNK